MRTNPQRPTLTDPRGGSTSDKSLPSDLGQATCAQSCAAPSLSTCLLMARGKGRTVGVYEAFAGPLFCEHRDAQGRTEARS